MPDPAEFRQDSERKVFGGSINFVGCFFSEPFFLGVFFGTIFFWGCFFWGGMFHQNPASRIPHPKKKMGHVGHLVIQAVTFEDPPKRWRSQCQQNGQGNVILILLSGFTRESNHCLHHGVP